MKKIISLACVAVCTLMLQAQTLSLNGEWKLSYWQQPEEPITSPEEMSGIAYTTIPANVPGNVELDLMNAGQIADVFVGSNNYLTRKWEDYQWCYSKSFDVAKKEEGRQYELCFGGIDCVADIWLNGQHVGHTENMLIGRNYEVTKFLKEGNNTLQVIIQSAVLHGRKYDLGAISIGAWASPEGTNFRKAPHMFGWDILPRIVSAGIWRDVELRAIESVRFRDVHWMTASVDTTLHRATLFANIQLVMPSACYDNVHALFTLSRNGRQVYQSKRPIIMHAFRQRIDLDKVDFWWPRGYGEAALYDAKCEIVDGEGKILARDEKKIGVRTVRLDFTDINLPDAPGKFCFVVNGEPIFIHGTNWVPLDALHSRDKLWVDETMAMAADMNCNMIRCWGGNVYEDHRFFDLCDQYGIMVWQDFSMGCNIYPQGDDFAKKIEEEVKWIVRKLRNHASLALWSGNNEDDQCFDGNWKSFGLDPNKDRVSRRVIPEVLMEYDPTRTYLPSSPYYSEEVFRRNMIDMKHVPENHLWGPRGYYKAPFYTEAECVFVSEIGYHGAPNIESLQKMMSLDCVYPWDKGTLDWNEEWLTKSIRQYQAEGKTMARNNLMINQQKLLFGEVATQLEDFVYASQVVQAEAMKYFVEMMRGDKFSPRTGIIWWNIRDGWPVISDAVVDYYMSKKRAFYYIKNVQHDVCCLINDAKDGRHPLVAVNDTRNEVQGEVAVTDVVSGKQLFKGTFQIRPNAKTDVTMIPEQPDKQGIYLITYKVGGKEYRNHYLYGKAPFRLSDYRTWINKTKIYD